MRRLLAGTAFVAALLAGALAVAGASGSDSALGSYKIEFDNAFGIVPGADFKVAGVRAGTIKSITLDQRTLHAVVTVSVTEAGFGSFHSDAFCRSRPQSLIGEYFIDCQPGNAGPPLPPGRTIPVTHTQSTIPADLLQNVLRLPYRQRLALIINELGAGVAARSDDLGAALRRAVPALTETDQLLGLLARDTHTLQQIVTNSDTFITALADNRRQIQRFIVQAGNAAGAAATQQANLQSTLAQLPGFLQQLQPAMAQLGAAASANEPVLAHLGASAGELTRLFGQLPPLSRAAVPAIRSLGQASVVGHAAVTVAAPTVGDLAAAAGPTPELAQNLAIVLHDLDDRSRAVEANSQSPGGRGYTGLEALLQYVFNQTLAINTFGPFGHLLAVDSFVDPMCSPYATPSTIALSLKQFGPSYRRCYAWLGPSQPAVNETDPSNPKACVPDPGGAPPGERGPRTPACRLNAADVGSTPARAARSSGAAASASAAAAGLAAAGRSAGGAPAGAAQRLINYLLAP
jgi:virulence factor Mce-like protein